MNLSNPLDTLAAAIRAMPDPGEFWRQIRAALLWRGWDSNCHCHACGAVRAVAALLTAQGGELEEFT